MSYTKVYRNLVLLVSGSLGGKVIALAAMPLITRLYSPQDFGLLSVFMSLTAILSVIVTLRYVVAFPLARKNIEGINLLAATGVLGAGIFIILSMCLIVLPEKMYKFFGYGSIYEYRWLLGLSILVASVYEVLSMWCVRGKYFREITISGLLQSINGVVAKVFLGWLSLGPLGLVVGGIVQSGSGVFIVVKITARDFFSYRKNISAKRMFTQVKKHRGMPAYRLPAQFAYILAAQIPMPITAKYYGVEVAGQLGLALMALALPISLIGQAAGKVYYAEIAGMNDHSKIYSFTKHITLRLFALALLPAFLLFMGGEYMFSVLFGSEWGDAGRYASILSLYLLSQFGSSPIISYLNVIGRQGAGLIIHVTRLFLVLLVFLICGMRGLDFEIALYVYSAILALHYCIITLILLQMMKRRGDKCVG